MYFTKTAPITGGGAELICQVTARTLVADFFQETHNFVSYHM